MNRITSAARIHLVAPWWLLLPWAIMASSLAINILIWGVADLAEETGGQAATAGLASLYVTLSIVFIQAVSALLPFAMSLGLSRRTFYLGTILFAAVQSLGYGVLLYVLLLVERGTGGWGVQLRFFRGFWAVDNPLFQVLVFAVPLFVFAVFGMAIGVVYKRFGSAGLYGLTIIIVLMLGGLITLVTWNQAWDSVGAWFSEQPLVALYAGWPLLLGAVVALAGYVGIRRVVP